MHYTFRQMTQDRFECTKWEDADPLETYEILWRRGPQSANNCSCPSRTPCKHLNMISEMIECGCMSEFWLWYFDAEKGWYTAWDQQITLCIETLDWRP